MAKKIRFPLVLAEGAQVRSLDELREHFDLETILGYYKTGKLLTWLEDRYLEGEAKAVRALDETAPDFQLRLCEALQVEYTGSDVDLEAIRIRQERLVRLRTMTDEDEFLQNIDSVAFDQEELADLLDEERTTVYLCGKRFTVPALRKGVTYVGINEPEVKISGELPENFDELGITFRACKVDRPEPPKLEPLKQTYRVEVPQGAKIVMASAIPPDMNVINGWQDIVSVTCSNYEVIGIKRDGTVVAEGFDLKSFGRWDWDLEWRNIYSIAWGNNLVVGLRGNGTVIAQSHKGSQTQWHRVDDWAGITAVACGDEHIAGLCEDGTVVAVGSNKDGQRYVQEWTDIVSIGCTYDATFGLKRNGTVVGTKGYYGTQDWTDIVSIYCSQWIIAGLKRDETVVMAGGYYMSAGDLAEKVSSWQSIISVACGDNFIAGLRRDGTVSIATNNFSAYADIARKARNWKNIVSIAAGKYVLVGVVGSEDSSSVKPVVEAVPEMPQETSQQE